ncbi:MAG: ribosome small subunit-dependent GTPase A [Rikenellaceae bacterium]
MDGIVIKATGSWYRVEDESTNIVYNCRLRGKMRMDSIRATNPISVGDIVVFNKESDDNLEEQGVITSVTERSNYIVRKATNLSKESHIIAANVSMAFLVVTIDFPVTNCEFIDRFLLSCEMYKVPVTIVINKIDLFTHADYRAYIDEFKKPYEDAGYKTVEVSALKKMGIENLNIASSGKVLLFAGNSGVGKSTIINAIAPNLDVKSGEISSYHKKGKHTTTFSEMFKIGEKQYLVDTPGIKGFGLLNVTRDEVTRYMPDLFKFSSECGFNNCTHTHEPRCAVKIAVQQGELSQFRYDSYLKILDDLSGGKYR